ncbi:DUF3768 domain-containing protein [Croceicoccus sp. F390]|uniref:DUF3768 domain-containing protein n=1 Tax=Croceicoccus esteveae TaxID=3075597 RepID=A0ABU2ZJ21_9SPHN|nr:DUF3768 domain-containing protein [Croceicoccus sp. F390]MDT0576390.1 DUF3768 domain-containing protein [Croceicoccus sp. F390]
MSEALAQTRPSTTERIAALNDRARLSLDRTARTILTMNLLDSLSDGKRSNDILAQARVMKAMRECTFSKDSPERDMAWFEVDDVKVMMKIDYYDADFEYGSQDPANAAETRRAITLMKPEDY